MAKHKTYKTSELPRKFAKKKIAKPGDHISFDGHADDVFFLAYEPPNVMVTFEEDEINERAVDDYDVIELTGRRTKVGYFRRSDEYHFLIHQNGINWLLRAGCRELEEPTLKKLEKRAHEFWHNKHGMSDSDHSYNDRRLELNKETRRKVSKAIAKLRA